MLEHLPERNIPQSTCRPPEWDRLGSPLFHLQREDPHPFGVGAATAGN